MKTSEIKVMNELYRAGYGYEAAFESLAEIMTLRRLAMKHNRLAEMSCNGEGYVKGKFYSWDNRLAINCSPAVSEDVSIWDIESDKVEAKIKAIANRLGLRVEFQGDPRG